MKQWLALPLTLVLMNLEVPMTPAGQSEAWPMYRSSAGRTAATAESLPESLTRTWQFDLGQPIPAWPRSDRMVFDRAPQPVIAGKLVLVGSTRDDTLRALDLATGNVRWQFTTAAPIRFAPAVWQDRVFLGSDDGYLYALALTDGRLLWKRRGGPGNELVLGNGRAISKWPVRGGPVVAEGKVYFAAGIWPSDGIYIYALDAKTGNVVWCNDRAGAIYMGQPHGGAEAESGVAAQGYLVVDGDKLLVPTGRAVPAAFRREDGEFAYFHLQKYGHVGGAMVMAVDGTVFNGGFGFALEDGNHIARLGGGALASEGTTIYRAAGDRLTAYRWKEATKKDRRGKEVTKRELAPLWTCRVPKGASVLAVAGTDLIVGGSEGVALVSIAERKVRWQAPATGTVLGLAVADGHLVATTDRGQVLCFGAHSQDGKANVPARGVANAARTGSNQSTPLAEAVRAWHKTLGVPSGIAVDLSATEGELAVALASETPLHVIAFAATEERATRLRQKLLEAGWLGHRVSVWHRDATATRLPSWIADVVVCEEGWKQMEAGRPADARLVEARRLQRPYGGLLIEGSSGDAKVDRRGALEGAGQWTHQYADAANTVNSGDRLVGGRLTIAWFRDVDFQVPQRHGRGPAPLFWQGILFHEGLDGVIAVNAYNGSEWWRYEVPGILRAYNGDELMGTAGTGSNMCVAAGRLYLRHDDVCDVLDAKTGRKLATWSTPVGTSGKRPPWGYLASDGKHLFGSEADPEHVVTYRFVNRGGDMSRLWTESKALFAMDVKTGEIQWRYAAEHSIRHNAIAVAAGRVFLIDRPQALFDRVKRPKDHNHPYGILRALDAKTGEIIWEVSDEVFGTLLMAVPDADCLVMAYQPTRFRLDSEKGDRIAVFRMSDGQRLWDQSAKYASRPLMREGVIYAQGGAWDLKTGKPVPFEFQRSYGCGVLAASQNLLVFRSATLGYYNIGVDQRVRNFGGMRPGCWINALPVGGMVVVPDASAGCRCSYLNRSWIALQGRPMP